MADFRLDRLNRILFRALHAADVAAEERRQAKQKSEADAIAEDYARRLAEKHLYRELLSGDPQDGMRFRWYFTHIKKDVELNELRDWIYRRIENDDVSV